MSRLFSARGNPGGGKQLTMSMPAHVTDATTVTPLAPVSSRRLPHARDLVITMVIRDLKVRYSRSLMGIAWSLLTPLSQLLVLNLLFTRIVPLDIPNYGAFLFVGLMTWSWFSNSLEQTTGSIVEQRELVRQPGFPVGLLPVITVATNLVHFVLAIPILAVLLLVERASFGAPIVLLPLLVAIQFAFTLGLGFFLATAHVTFRDTKHLLGVALLLSFYLTPVFYPSDRAPQALSALYRLNPMAILIESYRDVILHHRVPASGPLLVVVGLSMVLLVVGYQVFRRASERFVDEI
jgi:homopolymeric O-antigen transport system permease protein